MMRILVLSNCPLVESQGSGYVILNFCRGLRERGHTVTLVGPEDLECAPWLRAAKRHRIALGMALRALREAGRQDVLEFYGGESWLAASLLRWWPGRRFLLVSHSNGLETFYAEKTRESHGYAAGLQGKPLRWYQRLLNAPIRRAFTAADALVTVSKNERGYALSNRYQGEARVVAIENPLSETFLNLSPNFQRPAVVGFCGSWLLNKGTGLIARDLGRILGDFPHVRLKLVGVGEAFNAGDYFPQSVCDRIDVIPFVREKAALRALYESMSLLVAPSFYESFGLVTAEAMACGCAVVASRTGFAASLRDGKEALILPEPRSPFLYEAVKRLLQDEPLRQRIARAGHARVQNLRWPEAIETLEGLYLKWLGEVRS